MDFSQICIANVMMMLSDLKEDDGSFSLPRFRSMVLATIRKNKLQFKNEYGSDIVIAIDSGRSWRKDYFEFYKASRVKTREESTINWVEIFAAIATIKEELREYFPYRVIDIKEAEADDVIATLAHKFGAPLASTSNKILILSGDKDFVQLQKFGNVSQYSPVLKKKITTNDPAQYLIDHIIKGDKSDGVPNMLSADDVFMREGARQTTISAKRLKHYGDLIAEGICTDVGYHRNKMLIDLSLTPSKIKINILEEYEAQAGKTRSKLLTYFIKYRLRNHMENLGDF